jgi:TIR domain/NB-ARC domain
MTYIFISYSSQDVSLAKDIQQRLESANFRVWRDERSIKTDWSREIAFAIAEKVDVVCMIWTNNAEKSHWVKNEWLTTRAIGKLVIPCIFPNAPDLPRPLMNIEGIKFEDITDGCRRLIEHLGKLTSFSYPYNYTILPSNSYIPFNPNPDFVGRQAELVELFLIMIGNLNNIGLNLAGIVGMAGIGKTQLVVEFAYRFSFAFPDGIFWIQAADPNQWLKQFVEIARDYLQLRISDDSQDTDRKYLLELQKYCKAHRQLLIIPDNVQDPRFLNNPDTLYCLT